MIGFFWITLFTVTKLSSGSFMEVLKATDKNAYRVLVGQQGRVYVHTENSLMQLENLSLQLSNLAFRVNGSAWKPGSPSVSLPSVFELITLEQKQFLIVCGSAYDAPCLLHLASNISSEYTLNSTDLITSSQFGSPVSAMIVHSPSRYLSVFSAISPTTNGMYSGCNDTALLEQSSNNLATSCSRHYALSRRIISATHPTHFNIHYEHPMIKPDLLYIKAKPNVSFRYVHGFYAIDVNMTHNTYFLKNRPTADGAEIGYIIQICANDTDFGAYMEAKIECYGHSAIAAATTLTTQDGQFLYVMFHGGTHHDVTVMCVYNVHYIGNFFDDQIHQCFHNANGSAPDWIEGVPPACTERLTLKNIKCGYTNKNNRVLTSGTLTTNIRPLTFLHNITCLTARNDGDEGDVLFILGTNNGTILKTVLNKQYHRLDDLLSVTPTSSRVESLTMDPAGRAVFYISMGKVIKLAMNDCGIHTECAACLKDQTELMSCKWRISSNGHGACVGQTMAIENDTKYFEAFCPPIIDLVRPVTGPTSGGTRLTIQGHFGSVDTTVQASVFIGTNKCREVDRSQLPNRLICFTPPLSVFEDSNAFYVTVRVNITGISYGSRTLWSRTLTLPVNGEAVTPVAVFNYLEPWLNISEQAISRLSGGVQMILSGRHLNIGSNRSIAIGHASCDITDKDTLLDVTITCRTPEQNMQRVYNLSLRIDDADLSGATIKYIADPEIQTIFPTVTTASGGIKITVTGERLTGLGINVHLTAVNNTGHNMHWILKPGTCSYENSSLVCITGELQDSSKVEAVYNAVLVNNYGWLNNSSVGHVRVMNDPILEKSTRNITLVSNERPLLEIQSKGWSLIPIENFRVTVSTAIPCHVRSVNESIVCEVEIDKHVFPHGKYLPVQCSIGFRDYDVGTVALSKKELPLVSPPRAYNIYITYFIIAGAVIGCFVVAACIVFSIVKFSRYKSRRLRHDSFNVHFRQDDHVLSLEGLSESHGSDVLQNRQNDYQQRLVVQLTSGQEHSSDAKETTPLLTEMDPEILAVLDEKGLLIDSDCLILGEPVGEGHFGKVFKAYLRRVGEKVELPVAAKTMHRNNPKDLDVNMFIKEALIMKDFEHKNVMQLIGICFGFERLPLVVLPFLERGDLLSYIRNVNNVPRVRDLVMYGVDIANGMQYLAELKFVHRDLAARNCMLADDMTVKVSDFGLSRDVYEKEYYSSCDKTTKLPVKWMSPESLEFGHFSSKSDVWSYGVVLWELLTRGMCPYPAVDNWDIMRYLKSGRRLEKPDFCPEEVYQVMLHCWQWEPEDRPTFDELVTSIPEILCRRGRLESSRAMSESDCK